MVEETESLVRRTGFGGDRRSAFKGEEEKDNHKTIAACAVKRVSASACGSLEVGVVAEVGPREAA